jgi:hypothetical protein
LRKTTLTFAMTVVYFCPMTKKQIDNIKKQAKEIGPYSRFQTYKIDLTVQFLMFCKLIEVEPEWIINDFLHNVGMEHWPSYGKGSHELARAKAVEYLITCGYGQDLYSSEEIRKILRELESINSLWPRSGSDKKFMDVHANWRDQYHQYFFNKWFYMVRRKKSTSEG